MKVDRYTGTVLTVIALTLAILVCQNTLGIKNAMATGGIIKVALCDRTGQYCVDVYPTSNGFGENTGIRMGVVSLQG